MFIYISPLSYIVILCKDFVNSEKDTYNMFAKVFTNVGYRKLKETIANADCNNADTVADGKD